MTTEKGEIHMTLEELEERLQVLLDGDAITETSHQVTIQVFEELKKRLNCQDIVQAEMLFTHLPMALTRIDEGESVEGPNDDIMEEIRLSPYFEVAEELVAYIEQLWKKELPKEEQDFLYMHFSTIINMNLGGV